MIQRCDHAVTSQICDFRVVYGCLMSDSHPPLVCGALRLNLQDWDFWLQTTLKVSVVTNLRYYDMAVVVFLFHIKLTHSPLAVFLPELFKFMIEWLIYFKPEMSLRRKVYITTQNIWNKIEKPSKIRLDKKSLVSTFACFLTAIAKV